LFISIFQDESGITTVFTTASKYEVNPEDVKVNFSDVRGVIKIVYFYFKVVYVLLLG
jgi:hypothetical protein